MRRCVYWGVLAVALLSGCKEETAVAPLTRVHRLRPTLLATVLTLLFLPALYVAWYRIKAPA